MTEESMVLVIGVMAFFACTALFIWREKRRQYQWFLHKVNGMWGNVPDREYTAKELESISHYAKNHKGNEFMIDDITWNDLNMDQIFMMINGTVSSCGEDVLYQMLRTPQFRQDILEERNRVIEYFRTHSKERIQVQHILSSVRKMSELSISDYIYSLKQVERKHQAKYIVLASLMVLSVLVVFLDPGVGVLSIVVMLGVNGWVHASDSKHMEPFLNCVACIMRLLNAADGFEKIDNPHIQTYVDRIVVGKKKMKRFRSGAYLVTASNSLQDGFEAIVLSYLKLLFHVDFIKFYSMLKCLDGHEKEVEDLFGAMGELDALIAIASFREYLPYYSLPELELTKEGDQAHCQIEDMYHPMIQDPVTNAIQIAGGILVTGSNASGKSTFLKTVALNGLLAQSIYTCTAKIYRGSFVKVLTSMALRDNLETGESYYLVEIKSLNRILQECEKGEPVLCVVDEVLRGTNTVERIAASSQILRSLIRKNVIPLAATHDIELTYILEQWYANYHFEEQIREQDILFSYQIHKGRATSRNAIKLLEIIGYDKKIIREAQEAAEHFEQTGNWV